MAYIYQYSTRLSSLLCRSGCNVYFANARVSLYRSKQKECIDDPQIAKTFEQISGKDLKGRSQDLLAEGRADNDGNINLTIDGDKQRYTGQCIEAVVSFEHLPGSQKELAEEEHFLVARYKPGWRQDDDQFFHHMALVVPSNIWCAYLKKYDIWVICGRVVTCGEQESPIGNVKVKAFDVDWLQHDFLGEASTDLNGWFHIYYDGDQFKKTPLSPFINLEWTGGPDVYFQVEGVDTDGNPVTLLDEPPSRGRQPDREDVPNCFCEKLCIPLEERDPREVPMWIKIGKYQIPDSANLHDFRADGYSQAGNLAFTGTMTMIGQTGTATPARRLRYRFLFEENWTGPAMPANTVTKDMIAATNVGQILISNSPHVVESVFVNNPAAIHNIVPDANGWIEVETDSRFTPVDNSLIELISRNLAPAQSYPNPAPNSDAGNLAPVDAARQVHVFAIGYEVEEDTGSGWTLIHKHVMEKLVINNAGSLLWLELAEFITGASLCQPISHTVTVRYTVDHPHLDWFEVKIEKQSAIVHWPVPTEVHGGSLTFRGGHSTSTPSTSPQNPVTVSTWDACSYIVYLRARRRLTNGGSSLGNPTVGVENTYRTFCKS